MHVVTMNAFWFVVKGTPMNEPDMAQRKRGKRRRSGGRDAAKRTSVESRAAVFFTPLKFCVRFALEEPAAESRRKRKTPDAPKQIECFRFP